MTDRAKLRMAGQQPLSAGEVNFLWWFIQGSIMDVAVRRNLRRGWGMCDRHTAAWLTVEAAFRHGFMHGPAVLYSDLMQRAVAAFELKGPRKVVRLARRLHPLGPCHLCGMDLGPDSTAYCPDHRVEIGRDVSELRKFMKKTREFWGGTACGTCAHNATVTRCRAHLAFDLEHGIVNGLDRNREMVTHIANHIARYEQAFTWEHHGTDTTEDRAALISAAGWCGGWESLLEVCPILTC